MATAQHILSKSTFMYGCQCPLRLYLHKFRPELQNEEDEETAAVYIEGTNIGVLARDVFPGGTNAEPPDSFSYALSVEKTQTLLKSGASIIYEAAFNFEGVLCAIDILVMENGKWFAYEVKNSTKVKPAHIMDASLQYYVITNAGLSLKDISIMYLDNTYVKRGEVEIQKLFAHVSVLEQVKQHQAFIEEKANDLKLMLANKKQPKVEPGNHCFTPYDCNFTEHCWKNVVEEKQDYGKLKIDKIAIREFLDELSYPLFFFDFETVAHPVPVYDESRPYQQVPFQYSIHVKRNATAEMEHFAFLGDGINEPREQLIINLIKHCETKGTILVWYKPFENSRLKELARDFPNYEKEIHKLQERLVDLMVPFKKGYYHHPSFEGSSSIKKVLPVLVPELSYYDLEVQNGTMASGTYAKLKEQTEEIQTQQCEALLAYCHLDTLAMVRIFEKLNLII
jgi:CRISPR/Cas system-associated exonuclease Cas4 (RecB family)